MENWERSLRGFKQYLTLERSLSGNSVEAYLTDVSKYKVWCDEQGFQSPVQVDSRRILHFPQWIADMGSLMVNSMITYPFLPLFTGKIFVLLKLLELCIVFLGRVPTFLL